jgi:UDP-GlcNAc:undecaprenyl-phosphate/decaprenyl-phosphate GlcNAc-1-phosphate transferase
MGFIAQPIETRFCCAVSFVLTLVLTIALSGAVTFGLIRVAPLFGLVVEPSEGRWHSAATPTAGGIAIVSALAVALLLFHQANHVPGWSAWLVFVGLLTTAGLGLVDDIAALPVRSKLGLEIVVAAFLCTVGPNLVLTPNTPFNWILTFLWLLTTINAVNLIDGVDGLAGCTAAISATAIAIIAALHSQWGVVTWSLALLGSVGGFLKFNLSPAQIFMGDTGALSLGAILGVLSIQVSDVARISPFTRLFLPMLLLMAPVLDTMTVSVIRFAHGQPIGHRGLDHAHHRLGRMGLKDSRIVWVLCALQAVAGCAAISLSIAPYQLAVLATPLVVLPFALVALFLTDQSFQGDGPIALRGLSAVTRLFLNVGYKRRLIDVALDMMLIAAAYFGAFMLRMNFELSPATVNSLLHNLPAVEAIAIAAFFVARVYRGMWRYTAGVDSLRFAQAAALSALLVYAAAAVIPIEYDLAAGLIFGLLLFTLLGLSRVSFLFFHLLVRKLGPASARVLVVGADFESAEAARHLLLNPGRSVRLVGFVDDDHLKRGKLIHGRRVLGSVDDLDRIFEAHCFDELMFVPSSISSEMISKLREFAHRHSVVLYQFALGAVRVNDEEFLLERRPVLNAMGG